MQALMSGSPGASMARLCDLGQVASPPCALVSASEMEPRMTLPHTVTLRTRTGCRCTQTARGAQPRPSLLCTEIVLHPLVFKPDRLCEARRNLSEGSPLSLPPSSCCLFFRVVSEMFLASCLLLMNCPRLQTSSVFCRPGFLESRSQMCISVRESVSQGSLLRCYFIHSTTCFSASPSMQALGIEEEPAIHVFIMVRPDRSEQSDCCGPESFTTPSCSWQEPFLREKWGEEGSSVCASLKCPSLMD